MSTIQVNTSDGVSVALPIAELREAIGVEQFDAAISLLVAHRLTRAAEAANAAGLEAGS